MDARRLVVAALAGLIAVASGSTPDWGQTPASVLHLFCPHGTHAICSTPTTCTCVADQLVLLTGNVVGLSGKGLTLLNEGYSIAVSANGPVTILARAYEEYGVEVSAVPTGPLQACYVDNGYGTATASGNSQPFTVICGTPYTVGGTITGLVSGSSAPYLMLSLSSPGVVGPVQTEKQNGPFTFPMPLANGRPYQVGLASSPNGENCSIANGSGTIAGSNVTYIVVSCLSPAAQRKSVTALSAAELMSLRRGVAAMMARNNAPRASNDFRGSWIYWANMHQHFGNDCGGPISGQGMAGVQSFIASNADETATWCKCQHFNNQFLTWHRMFLWYFERVLQQAAGDPSLRLPYWDYETNGQIPAAYRDATYVNENGQTVPNPLRVEARQPSLNSGATSLISSVTSTSSAMAATSFSAFSGSLEQTPHGAVHCATVTGSCPNGLMGAIPASALDPIFWAHHTNIDRLYECWLHVNEAARLPNDPTQLATQFTFIDADGSTPTRRVSDMLTTAQLGYSYAGGGGCPAAPFMLVAAAQTEMTPVSEQVLATAGPTRIEPALTTVPLTPAPAGPQAPTGRTYLVIDGLQYDEAPGGLYNVYLEGPDGRRVQIGVINFFGLASSRATDHAHGTHTSGSFRFDATDTIRQLGISGNAVLRLVFEPTSGLTSTSMTAAADLAPQMNAQANVRFESAKLVTGQ